eukprot:SAG31_NODE_9467_length_1273_cov_1.071550_1_plen_96_part_00
MSRRQSPGLLGCAERRKRVTKSAPLLNAQSLARQLARPSHAASHQHVHQNSSMLCGWIVPAPFIHKHGRMPVKVRMLAANSVDQVTTRMHIGKPS